MKQVSGGIIVVLLLSLAAGCALHRQEEQLRTGVLKLGLHKNAFLGVWGEPTRTDTISSDEFVRASWGGYGGGFFKGKTTLEKWTYTELGVELIFDRDHLAGWKTERTVQELKAAARH